VKADLGDGRALYSISVTAELTGVNPQMLRAYESKGLLTPFRTKGGTRRYSGRDLDRIGEVTTLLAAGLNLAGVEHVLALRAETLRLRAEIDRLRARMTAATDERRSAGSPLDQPELAQSWPGRSRPPARTS
jgi:MerR family transcriptional regulator/heat shock protein HspR